MNRFDIVVWNYDRLELFFRNFHKIRNFDPVRDRITIVSTSPSMAESHRVEAFEREHKVEMRYLPRRNYGIDQLGRAEYFTGRVGDLDENLSHAYILQMQDHYLDLTSDASRSGPELGFKIKEDVVPDDFAFDLDRMEQLGATHDLKGFFCDRADPWLFSLAASNYIAPNGGNFTIRTAAVRDEPVQRACRDLMRSCDNRWDWAVYAEFMWGVIFFQEGERFYDLKRDRLFEKWNEEAFSRSYEPIFHRLKRFYDRPALVRAVLWRLQDPRTTATTILRFALCDSAYGRLRTAWRRRSHRLQR
jgi:hypothetical protein